MEEHDRKTKGVLQKGLYCTQHLFSWELNHFCQVWFLKCLWKLQIAKKNKEKYTQEMEAYKQYKDEEAMNLKKEEEELMEFQREKDPRGWKDWIFQFCCVHHLDLRVGVEGFRFGISIFSKSQGLFEGWGSGPDV